MAYRSKSKSTSKTLLITIASLLVLVGLVVANYVTRNRSISPLAPESNPEAFSAACTISLSLKTPPPPTSSPTPPPMTCTNWAIDEHSGTGSNLVKVDYNITNVSSPVTFYDCTKGTCDFENLDAHPTTGVLYAIPNRNSPGSKKLIYTINTKANDNIADGTLTLKAQLDKDLYITGTSFRKSDNSFWVWARGAGIHKVDLATGKTTLVMASTLTNVEAMAWDNESKYLYLSRTAHSTTPRYAPFELHRYDPSSNQMAYYAPMPGETDAIDFAPSNYQGGLMMGAYRTGLSATTLYVFTYNVNTKQIIKKYTLNSPNTNFDAMSVCLPN